MTIELHRAVPGDEARLLEMMAEYYAFDALDFDETRARRAVEGLLAEASRGEAWLAVAEGKDVGYGVLCLGWSLEFHGQDAFLDEIYLRSGVRGRGLGQRIIAHLEERCRALGVVALHLEVERSNHRARKIYGAAGFAEHDRFLMTKRLPG